MEKSDFSTIDEAWNQYFDSRNSEYDPETRRAFYAGATALFLLFSDFPDNGNYQTTLENVKHELVNYAIEDEESGMICREA